MKGYVRMDTNKSWIKCISRVLIALGLGIIFVGYMIGTGSIVSHYISTEDHFLLISAAINP